MSKDIRDGLAIIEKNTFRDGSRVDSIRNHGGALVFFPEISHYDGQDERYRRELKEQHELAEVIYNAINSHYLP